MSSSFLVVFDTIFDENATYGDLLKLVAVLAVLVRAIFYLLEPIISWLSNGPLKQRYLRIAELEYNRSDKIEEQEMFGVTTKEEYVEHIAASLSNFLRTSITHLTGGMCTIPFLLGLTWLSTSVRISIACLGIVIEMAFEVQDFGDIVIYRLFMGAEGKKKIPNIMIFGACLHHCLTCSMGLPMILNYRELPELHRMCFDLQFAGGFGLVLIELSRALDVTKKKELLKFLFMTVLLALLVVWTRLFDWFYLVYKLLARFYADENWTYLVVGGTMMLCFSMMNLFFVQDTCIRLLKFAKKWKHFDSLPADASEVARHSSIFELQAAAADVIESGHTRFEDNFSDMAMAMLGFEDRHVERRKTFNSATLSRSAARAALSTARPSMTLRMRPHRQSMTAWRGLPSRQAKQNKTAEQEKVD